MGDLAVTKPSVGASNPLNALRGIAGAAVEAGNILYQDPTDGGKLKLADANAADPANTVAGIALNDAGSGQPVQYVAIDSSLTPGFTALAGDPIYLSSDSPGKMTKTFTDLDAGSTVIVLGVMKTTTTMNFMPCVGGAIAAGS